MTTADERRYGHRTVTGRALTQDDTMHAQQVAGAVALVTGANRGLGRALTEALLARGARKVYATARNPEALRGLADNRVVALPLDVTDVTQVQAVRDASPDLELVFSNAGVAMTGGLSSPTIVDQARREMEVNYFGTLQLLAHLAPTLAQHGGGAVVIIGSLAGLSSFPLLPTYSGSKAALHSLTQMARVVLGAHGTSVFGVYPGPIDTEMSRELMLPKASPRDVAATILDGIEAGEEDIFPDAFASEFGRQYLASPKAAERQIAAMSTSTLLSGTV